MKFKCSFNRSSQVSESQWSGTLLDCIFLHYFPQLSTQNRQKCSSALILSLHSHRYLMSVIPLVNCFRAVWWRLARFMLNCSGKTQQRLWHKHLTHSLSVDYATVCVCVCVVDDSRVTPHRGASHHWEGRDEMFVIHVMCLWSWLTFLFLKGLCNWEISSF